MEHAYQKVLKAVYDAVGMRLVKTPELREKGVVEPYDFTTLSYLRRKKLVHQKGRWDRESIARELERDLNKSDKLSSWWKVTDKGLAMVFDIYGYESVKQEDQKRLVQYLLKREQPER